MLFDWFTGRPPNLFFDWFTERPPNLLFDWFAGPTEIENCTLSLYNSTTEDIPQNPLPCDERNTTEKDIFPQCRCTLEQEKTLNDEILAQVNTAKL